MFDLYYAKTAQQLTYPRPSNYFFLRLYIEHMHALSIKMSPVNRQNGRHPFKPEEILVLCNKANELEDFMNYKSVFTKKRHLFEHKCQNRQLGEGGRGVMVGWQRPLNPLLYFFAEPHSMFQSTKKLQTMTMF